MNVNEEICHRGDDHVDDDCANNAVTDDVNYACAEHSSDDN